MTMSPPDQKRETPRRTNVGACAPGALVGLAQSDLARA